MLINSYKIIDSVKRILSPIILICLTTFLYAQPYNNGWINHSQKYYKFKIAETGIYRISYSTLINAGITVSSITLKTFSFLQEELKYQFILKVKTMVFLMDLILLSFMENITMAGWMNLFMAVPQIIQVHIIVCLMIPLITS